MNKMKKINVMLYGGFDKKTKNQAEIIMCDKCENCSFYKKNQCLNVSTVFSNICKFGKINKVEGYTQRAQKRGIFDSKYKNDECYGKLKHPSDWRVGLIEDVVVFNLTFAICDKRHWNSWKHEWEDIDEYKVRECGFSTGTYSYIPLEELNTDILCKILKYKPMTIFDYKEIKDYQNKIVPNVLFELSKLLPELYEKLIADYPEFKEIAPNFVGKNALIKSLADGTVLNDSKGTFVKQGNYLISNCWKSAFLPFNSRQAEVKIEITDNMTYTITNNSQVDENTVFE